MSETILTPEPTAPSEPTEAQRRASFVAAYRRTGSAVAAYREAFIVPDGMGRKDVYKRAQRELKRPEVVAMLHGAAKPTAPTEPTAPAALPGPSFIERLSKMRRPDPYAPGDRSRGTVSVDALVSTHLGGSPWRRG